MKYLTLSPSLTFCWILNYCWLESSCICKVVHYVGAAMLSHQPKALAFVFVLEEQQLSPHLQLVSLYNNAKECKPKNIHTNNKKTNMYCL
jgi:hypothetical protein